MISKWEIFAQSCDIISSMSIKIAFHTLGCKVNQYETEALKEKFVQKGYEIVSDEDRADIYVINTCTVTNLADRKSRQFIRKAKRLNEDAVIAVTGCYAETDPDEVSSIEGVSLVCGTGEKAELPKYIEEYMSEKGVVVEGAGDRERLDSYHSDGIITGMDSRTRAYIKIEEGCDRFCSYCIIPYARGKVRSRSLAEIKAETKGLVDRGFKEIVLTGINTALYGKDIGFDCIEPLIAELDAMPENFRIRLSSLEPTVINKEQVRSLLKYKKLCPHLHLSIQSGSDNTLSTMSRRYTRQEYLDIVKELRSFDPHYGITTDIIVGFPGESDEDFAESISVCDEAQFVKVHAFKYSPRRGTKAAEMKNQIHGELKNQRSQALIAHAEKVSEDFRRSCEGSIRTVLFEEFEGDALMCGYTDNYIRVYTQADESKLNEFCKVKLDKVYKDGMKGVIIDE